MVRFAVPATVLALALAGPAQAADRPAPDSAPLSNTLEKLRDTMRSQKYVPSPSALPPPVRVRDPDHGFPHFNPDDDNDYTMCYGAGAAARIAAMNRDEGHTLDEEMYALGTGRTGGTGKPAREKEIAKYVWSRPDMTPEQLYRHYQTACIDRINSRLATEPPKRPWH